MEFKGTKGKWTLHTFPEGQMSVRNESDTRKICVPRVNNYDESLHNLLLISKAPEMLEMLESFVNDFDSGLIEDFSIPRNRFEKLIEEATEL